VHRVRGLQMGQEENKRHGQRVLPLTNVVQLLLDNHTRRCGDISHMYSQKNNIGSRLRYNGQKCFVGKWGECLSKRNMARNDIDRTTAQQQKHFRIVNIRVKSTRMSTAATRSLLGLTAERTFSLLVVGILQAFAPLDAIVNSVSRRDAGFGYKNRASPGKTNL